MHAALTPLLHGGVAAAALAIGETAGNKVWESIPPESATMKTHAVPIGMLALGATVGYLGRNQPLVRTAGIAIAAGGFLHEIATFLGSRADVNFGG